MTQAPSNQVAVQKPSRFTVEQIASASIESAESGSIDFSNVQIAAAPESTETWIPEAVGETVLALIDGIYPDETVKDGEKVILEHVFFITQGENKKIKRMRNGNKVLVSTIKRLIENGTIAPKTTLTPVQIVFMGKKKNATNAYSSKNYEVTMARFIK